MYNVKHSQNFVYWIKHLLSAFFISLSTQAWMHTGFHHFTLISQIFQNNSETQERGLRGVKIQTFPGGPWPWTYLEAWSFSTPCFKIGHNLSYCRSASVTFSDMYIVWTIYQEKGGCWREVTFSHGSTVIKIDALQTIACMHILQT